MGAFPIRGLDMLAWDDEGDLVAIKPRATPDLLSKWLTNTVFPFLHRTLGQRIKVTKICLSSWKFPPVHCSRC